MNRRYRRVIVALALTGVVSVGLLIWAAQKMYAIGVNASASGGNGGTDMILWLWFFLGFTGMAFSIAGLCVLQMRTQRQRDRPAPR